MQPSVDRACTRLLWNGEGGEERVRRISAFKMNFFPDFQLCIGDWTTSKWNYVAKFGIMSTLI